MRVTLYRIGLGVVISVAAGCSLLPVKDELLDADGDSYNFDDDCNDQSAAIHPDANEICDEADNDCDGLTDEDDSANAKTWYIDNDSDGYGSANTTAVACTQPEGFLDSTTDCDDEDGDVYPGAEEVPYNGIDDDCEPGTSDDDLDGDGFTADEAGGNDCDDENNAIYPGAEEVCDDGVVNDCDGNETTAMGECGLGGTLNLSTADVKFIGEFSYDYAGASISGAGDVDGDGFDDVVIGAYGEDSGGSSAGAVYLLLWEGALEGVSGELSLSDADLKLTGEAEGDYAGNAISGVGDVDGDGYGDLLIGAYAEDSVAATAGAAYLLFGGDMPEATSNVKSLADADIKLAGEASPDNAGWAVSDAGDVDDDGHADLLIGAPDKDTGKPYTGAVYLLSGNGALKTSSDSLSLSSADAVFTGEDSYDEVGNSVSGAGDVDGDGLDDVLAGAFREATGGSEAGAAYLVLSAGALGSLVGILSLSDADLKLTGEDVDNHAGIAVSKVGDVNGDGFDELLIGAYGADGGGEGAGAAYLLLGAGAIGGEPATLSLSTSDLKVMGEAPDDSAGWSVSDAGDVDGDERADILIGAYHEDGGGSSAGAAYLLLGGGALSPGSGTLSLSIADLKVTGEVAYDHAGISVSGAGDVNGDGCDDLLVGADNENSGGTQSGAAYLLFGGRY